jgi:hypothetical protein
VNEFSKYQFNQILQGFFFSPSDFYLVGGVMKITEDASSRTFFDYSSYMLAGFIVKYQTMALSTSP